MMKKISLKLPTSLSQRARRLRRSHFFAFAALLLVLVVGGITLFATGGTEIAIDGDGGDGPQFDAHPLSGRRCENNNTRPFAVMLAGDAVTRPLSGISLADVVVEMPVLEGGITRFMAVFACNEAEEIGSVRSARHDFIPLAAAFDAMYGHWGGSHFALDLLDAGVIDNFNGLTNPGNAYYRKNGIAAPHNGFTSYERLTAAAERLGYRTSYEGPEYPHQEGEANEETNGATLSIDYGGPFRVSYIYSAQTNRYSRFRGGTPENDRDTTTQVEAAVVAVLRATSRQVEPSYNDVDVTGSGELILFQNGQVVKGRWQKADTPRESKLFLLDEDDEEIELVAGQLWLQYVSPDTDITWNEEVQ